MAMNAKTERSFWERTRVFFQQVRTETDKVSWPTRDEIRKYALVTLVSTVIFAIFLGGWDMVLIEVLKRFFTGTA